MSTLTETKTIIWTGQSGKEYQYWIYPINTSFNAKSGNYCFSKETSSGYWTPLYFGESEDLSGRFDNHHKIDMAIRRGATHIHAHVNNGSKIARINEETDLIRKWNPPCNG
ncbi:MAG: hypothetical protein AABY33_06965 [Pseudomonadota bacterium]